MARKISSRLRISGTFVAETPLHVGGYGDSPDTDLPLAQNGRGESYVPGTSIAGVLRSWCENSLEGQDAIKELFGPKRVPGKEEGHASFVLVDDATIENAKEVLTEIRDGVGIDRFYGVAADKAKYDRAILPRGTKLSFVMTVEMGENKKSKQTKAIIRYLLEALTKSRVRLGAAKTRGLGRVKLTNCTIKEEGFSDFEAIIKLLRDENAAKPFANWRTEFESSLSETEKTELKKLKAEQLQLVIEINWKPRLPVMVKAGYDGIGVDVLPLTSGIDKDRLALVLPGSSIRGVLRSHAEKIIRTLLPDCSCTKDKKFNDQIDATPLVEELFGSRSKSKEEGGNGANDKRCSTNPKAKLGLGALATDDCYAKESMEADLWREVEVALDDKPKEEAEKSNQAHKEDKSEVSYFKRELWRYLREIEERKSDLTDSDYAKDTSRFKIQHHVAIDRWTGGASDGALYSVLAPNEVHWEPMRLTLDFRRVSDESRLPALMLLLLTLRDVAENRLPFGFATNRGMGEIEVTGFEVIGSGKFKVNRVEEQNGEIAERDEEIEIDLNALSATVDSSGRCKFADSLTKEQLEMRWKKWLQ